jgi:hypothetical protein
MARFDEKTGERLDPEGEEPKAPAKAPKNPETKGEEPKAPAEAKK